MQDGLTPVLEKIRDADALILGSPIYFGMMTGMMRCFMERLMFPYLTYTKPPASLFPKIMPIAFIYTMNVSEQQMKEIYASHIGANEHVLKMIFGRSETLSSNETLQFEDYDKVVFSYFDPEERKQRRRTAGERLSLGHGSDSEQCGLLIAVLILAGPPGLKIALFLPRAKDAMQHRPH